jgi:hypothetical protein
MNTLPRWSRLRLALAAGTAFAAACASAPSAPAQIDPPFPTPGPLGATARVYAVEQGWFDGQVVQYYNLGTNTPLRPDNPGRVLVTPVWIFVTGVNPDGGPIKLDGQDSLFDAVPGEAGYTDLWQAFFVTPPADYAPNRFTSAEALLASGLQIEKQALLVNCPIVPPGSSLADGAKELTKGWVRGEPVVYFDFGPTSAEPGKVYAFVTGFNAEGSPQLVPGQRFVFSASRASTGYSDFWVVHWARVDPGYRADSIRAEKDIDPSRVTASTLVVNYPQK